MGIGPTHPVFQKDAMVESRGLRAPDPVNYQEIWTADGGLIGRQVVVRSHLIEEGSAVIRARGSLCTVCLELNASVHSVSRAKIRVRNATLARAGRAEVEHRPKNRHCSYGKLLAAFIVEWRPFGVVVPCRKDGGYPRVQRLGLRYRREGLRTTLQSKPGAPAVRNWGSEIDRSAGETYRVLPARSSRVNCKCVVRTFVAGGRVPGDYRIRITITGIFIVTCGILAGTIAVKTEDPSERGVGRTEMDGFQGRTGIVLDSNQGVLSPVIGVSGPRNGRHDKGGRVPRSVNGEYGDQGATACGTSHRKRSGTLVGPSRGRHQHEQGHTEDRKGHFLHRRQRSSWHQKSFHGNLSLFFGQGAKICSHGAFPPGNFHLDSKQKTWDREGGT